MASGSDKRLREHTVTVRLSDGEREKLDELSSRSGLAVGAFMRAAAFGDSGPRAQRRPPADHAALRQIRERAAEPKLTCLCSSLCARKRMLALEHC